MYDLGALISLAVINVIVSLHLFPCTKNGTRLNVYTYNRTPLCGYGIYARANFMGMWLFCGYLRILERWSILTKFRMCHNRVYLFWVYKLCVSYFNYHLGGISYLLLGILYLYGYTILGFIIFVVYYIYIGYII